MENPSKKCPLCAEQIPLEAETCEYCGARFAVSVAGYCTHCHDMREADVNGLCKVCKTEVADRHVENRLLETPPPEPVTPVNRPPVASSPAVRNKPAKKTSSAWGCIFGLGLGICGLFFIMYMLLPPEMKTFAAPTATFTNTKRPTSTPRPTRTRTRTPTPSPIEITFDTVDDYPAGTLVTLAGQLALFSSTHCGLTCGILLQNLGNSSQKITVFIVQASEGTEPLPRMMKFLPQSYSPGDIQIRLDDGSYVLVGARVRITGRICETTSGKPCIDSLVGIELWK